MRYEQGNLLDSGYFSGYGFNMNKQILKLSQVLCFVAVSLSSLSVQAAVDPNQHFTCINNVVVGRKTIEFTKVDENGDRQFVVDLFPISWATCSTKPERVSCEFPAQGRWQSVYIDLEHVYKRERLVRRTPRDRLISEPVFYIKGQLFLGSQVRSYEIICEDIKLN